MDAIQTKAYTIFLKELKKQGVILSAFVDSQSSLSVEEAEREELRMVLHRIKGAAGFFDLMTLKSVAEEAENLVREKGTIERSSLILRVSSVVKEIRKALSKGF